MVTYIFWSGIMPLFLSTLVIGIVGHKVALSGVRKKKSLNPPSVEETLFGSETSTRTERLEREVLPAKGAPSIIELVQQTEHQFDEDQKPKPVQQTYVAPLSTRQPGGASAFSSWPEEHLCCHGVNAAMAFPCPSMRSYGMDPSSISDYQAFKGGWEPTDFRNRRNPYSDRLTAIMVEGQAEPIGYIDSSGMMVGPDKVSAPEPPSRNPQIERRI